MFYLHINKEGEEVGSLYKITNKEMPIPYVHLKIICLIDFPASIVQF